MEESLLSIVTVLKRSTKILQGDDVRDIIKSIEEMTDNDKTRVVFLGQLIKYRSLTKKGYEVYNNIAAIVLLQGLFPNVIVREQ